ncbi:LOW QUALITY PROTEIN: proteasomal ubiquitin receptor ADRM1-like [Trichoplusia ni]|uniref:Proteasomal ubiquitin receptor ADRM1 homolog n=1 Tax=Trichoplusia ni TaxID=7111 RepID=A0A7E5X0J1_TRINI|nr:LOW QUALITY PROTEIN: proteasomal ubiquitin receptor ADRM1-like [Trichoplusia ni]
MSATALFGNTSGLGGSSGGNKHLVEFRAGRMTLKGRMVHPDKRKGLLYVYQGEDSLMHFCWKDRTTGEVEDDLLIFPDDCEFVRVGECTTGRVYVLKFKSFSKKYFFGCRYPKTDKDDDYCRRINEALNNPPTSGGRGGSSGVQDGELQNILNNMSQQQLMQLLGGVGQIGGLSSLLGTMGNNSSSNSGNTSARPSAGSGNSSRGGSAPRTTESGATRTPSRARDVPAPTATPPNTATATQPRDGAGGQIYLSDLQRYFSGLGNAPPESEAGAGGAAARVDGQLGSNAPRLAPHLPPAPSGAAQDDAANQFSSALTSGQMGPVISQFGLPSEVASAANTGDMQAFFKALETTSNASENKPKEGMTRRRMINPKKIKVTRKTMMQKCHLINILVKLF